jgi:hypothetical protein
VGEHDGNRCVATAWRDAPVRHAVGPVSVRHGIVRPDTVGIGRGYIRHADRGRRWIPARADSVVDVPERRSGDDHLGFSGGRLPQCSSGSFAYLRQHKVDVRSGLWFAATAVPGSILGAWRCRTFRARRSKSFLALC